MQNNNIQFSDSDWSILKYLYNKDAHANKDDIETIAAGLNIEKPLALLMVSKLMNDGYVSRIIDTENNTHYVLSLEGFELFQSQHRN